MSTLLIPKPSGTVTSVNTLSGDVVLTTLNVTESGSNLYYSDIRARNALSTGGNGLNYSPFTGVFTLSASSLALANTLILRDSTGAFSTFKASLTSAAVTTLTATDLYVVNQFTCSNNLVAFNLVLSAINGVPYFAPNTPARNATADDVPESGSPTNKYFTPARVLTTQISTLDPTLTGFLSLNEPVSSAINRLNNMVSILSGLLIAAGYTI